MLALTNSAWPSSTGSPGASSYTARASNDMPTPCNDVPAQSTGSPGASSYLARGSNDVPMPCNVSGQQPAASSTGSAKVESVAQQTCQARSCQVDQPARVTSLTISLSTSLHRTICSDVLASSGPCLVSSTTIIPVWGETYSTCLTYRPEFTQ